MTFIDKKKEIKKYIENNFDELLEKDDEYEVIDVSNGYIEFDTYKGSVSVDNDMLLTLPGDDSFSIEEIEKYFNLLKFLKKLFV